MGVTHKPKAGAKLTGTEYEAADSHVLSIADGDIPSTIARDSEVTAAISALSSVYQPLDSDLTSIAALTTTAFGRGLLELANAAALLSAAGGAAASHAHAGGDITSGTVAEARIDSAIARDSEVTSAISALSSVYQPLDSDLTSIAALTTTAFGRGLLELADQAALLAAAGASASGHTHSYQPADATLTALASSLTAAGKVPYASATDTLAEADSTSYGRGLLNLADQAALQAAVGSVGGTIAGWYDVTAYGATGDGTTDDQPAIQAALDAAGAAGGGVVWFPTGRYKLTSVEVTDLAHLHNPYSHVHMVGAPGAVLVSSAAVAMIYQGQQGTEFEDATVYPFDGTVARGSSTVTTATAAHAGNFAAGDWVLLRTGQLTASAVRHPDAEINQVVSAVAGTGVITLKWPTCKSYAQEYFISGTSGFTSTSVTANAAQFGIANITSLMTEDQSYRGLRFEHTGSNVLSRAIIGGYTVYTTIERNTGSLPNGFESRGAHRFSVIRDNVFDHPGANPSESYTFTDDTMCSDSLYVGNVLTGQHIPQFHLQEGCTGIVVRDNIIRAPGTGSDHNAISIRTRARDVSVIGNIIDTYSPALIYVDATSTGGVIADNQLLGSQGSAIAIAGTGYKVSGNRVPNGAKVNLGTYIGGDSDRRVMSCWVYHDSTEVVLGPFPGHIVVYEVRIWVQQAFNPAGTGTISVGSPEADATAFGTATDVKTTGLKTVTLGAYAAYSPLNHTLTAYYAQTSTAAGQGKALVVVEYAHVGEGVGYS